MEEERIERPVKCYSCLQVNCKISNNDVLAHSVGKKWRMYSEDCSWNINQQSVLGRNQLFTEKKPRIVRIQKIFGATPNEAMEEKSTNNVEYQKKSSSISLGYTKCKSL